MYMSCIITCILLVHTCKTLQAFEVCNTYMYIPCLIRKLEQQLHMQLC